MIYKHSFLFAIAMATFSLNVFTACSSDDDDNSGNGNSGVLDNEKVLPMLKVDKDDRLTPNLFGLVYVGKDDNFHVKYDNGLSRFSTVGLVGKLDDISFFPKVGWSELIPVEKGSGYILCDNMIDKVNPESITKFYRFYVEDEMFDSDGKVVGYNVRYNEKPFYGKNTGVKLPKNEISFTNKGGYELLTFTDCEPVSFTCKSSASWCNVIKTSSYNDDFLTDGVEIKASPSDQ